MAKAKRLEAGYCSSGRYAEAIRRHFAENDVPPEKLAVNGNQHAEGSHLTHVAVQEGKDTDMTRQEWSAYRTTANHLLHAHAENRYATDHEDVLLVEYDHIQTMSDAPNSPVEAGEQLAEPSDIEDSDTVWGEINYDPEMWSVRNGQGVDKDATYVVNKSTMNVFCVEFDGYETEIYSLVTQTTPKDGELKKQIIGAAIAESPSDWDGGVTHIAPEITAGNAGGQAATNGSGGSTDDGGDDGEPWDSGPTPDSKSEDIETLKDWFNGYAQFKSDFDPDAVVIEAGAWEGTEGYKLESDPFESGYYEGDSWNDKEAYDAHEQAFRDLMQSDDAEAVEYHGEPHYVNFLAASEVDTI